MSRKTTSDRRAGAETVTTVTIAMFMAVFALLVWRLLDGQDPAIGAAIGSPLAGVAEQPVLHRRLIVHRKVVTSTAGSTAGLTAG